MKKKDKLILPSLLTLNGFTVSLDKLSMNELPIFFYLTLRYFLISLLTLILPGKVNKDNSIKRDLIIIFENKKLSFLFVSSIVISVVSTLAFFMSYEYVPVSLITTMEYGLQLVIVTILSVIFLKEKFTKKSLFFTFLSAIGLCVIFLEGEKIGNASFMGLFLMFIYSSLTSVDMLFIKQILNEISFKTITFFKMFSISLSMLILGLISEDNFFSSFDLLNMKTLLIILVVVALSYGNRFLTSLAIFKFGPAKTSLLLCLIPVSSLIVATIMFNEDLSFIQYFGISLTVASIFLANKFKELKGC